MYQYSFDDDTTKKIEDSTKRSKDIFEKFSDVDSKYNTLTKSDVNLNLEKMSYDEPTQDEKTTKEKNKLEDYKTSNINSIEEKYDKALDQVEKTKQDTTKSASSTALNIEEKYDKVKEDSKNDAIKRGLARSSIIVNTLNNLDMQKLESLKELEQSTNAKLQELNASRDSLENQKQNALASFDITYAVKLQDEINSISNEIEKNKQTVIKYNNEMDNLMAKWEKQQEQDEYDNITKLAKFVSEYGSSAFDTLKQNEKYDIASEYFAGMSKNDALAEITNNSAYKKALGTANYNKLVEEITGRE